jgi:hypothetical protein
VNRPIVRSIVAVAAGWGAATGTCAVGLVLIGILHRGLLGPDALFSTSWLLVILAVGGVCSILGGFVTGAVAQRREIAHALGLALFTLLLSVGLANARKGVIFATNWSVTAGYISTALATLLGGWLRMRQRILLDRGSETMVRATDRLRFPTAVVAAVVTFTSILYGGMLAGAGLMLVLGKLFSRSHVATDLFPMCMSVVFSIALAGYSARYVFMKIVGKRASAMHDRAATEGTADTNDVS